MLTATPTRPAPPPRPGRPGFWPRFFWAVTFFLLGAPARADEEGAEVGDVVRDPGEALGEPERVAYDEVARSRYPLALVRKMYDRNLVVVKARAGDKAGERYRDAREGPGERVLLAGNAARYDFKQAREFGLCQQDARATVADVAIVAYQLPRAALDPDPL